MKSKDAWSLDDQHFTITSLSEFLHNNPHLQAGDTVWVGDITHPNPRRLCNTADVIRTIARNTEDLADGSIPYNHDVGIEAAMELDGFLTHWIQQHVLALLFEVSNPRPYILSGTEATISTIPVADTSLVRTVIRT